MENNLRKNLTTGEKYTLDNIHKVTLISQTPGKLISIVENDEGIRWQVMTYRLK